MSTDIVRIEPEISKFNRAVWLCRITFPGYVRKLLLDENGRPQRFVDWQDAYTNGLVRLPKLQNEVYKRAHYDPKVARDAANALFGGAFGQN